MAIVDRITHEGAYVEARIRVGQRSHQVYFGASQPLSGAAAEALLLLALPAAMRSREALILEDAVSPRLLSAIPTVQDIYHSWDRDLRPVDVRAPARQSEGRHAPTRAGRVALAFTGGVDSFYSALRAADAALLYVHGLDIPLANHQLRGRVRERLAWAASELGRPLLEMETNLREFSDRYLDWPLAFGGALAACALLRLGDFAEFGIPAGQSYAFLQPDGAHPVLNPLFSTEDLAIRTLGCEARRVDKVQAIASHPVVHGALRVCWENRGDAYNCGVCEKCLRTMAAMDIFGGLECCSTFAVPLDYRRLARAVAAHASLDMFVRDNLEAARLYGARPELIESLEKALDPGRIRVFRMLRAVVPQRLRNWHYRVVHRNSARR